jgi:predicted outer membrane protein
MLSLAAVTAVAFAQTQLPPTAPRAQSPAQDNSQPGGLQSSRPGIGQSGVTQQGQPGSQNQLQQGSQQRGQQQGQQQQQTGQQQTGQQRTANFRGELADQGGSQMIDGHLAACLILGNEEEVALGRFASQHASSDQVKRFAQQMVDEHTKAADQLRQFAPQGASLQLTSSESGSGSANQARSGSQGRGDSSSTARTDASGSGGSSASGGVQSGAQQQMLAIERDAKQQCLDLTQRELSEKRGSEFDHAYLGQQMVGHVQMVANLTAFEKHASPDLQRVIAEQRRTAEQHLDHIKQMKESQASK